MLLPVDVPAIQVQTVNLLIRRYIEKRPDILIPTFKGKKGHPPIFNAIFKSDFLNLDVAIGLNHFERAHEPEIDLFPVDDPGVMWSFNTPEEFKKLKAYFKFSP